ncbi:hypothetical protein WR25_03553 [Diploscapter pachys]|uniref:Uncharacterized protein n=1 Tax=Diploscapter pachys TaxID=2018661 RepID=A0A2A2K4J4_9BILA|nr:hypothetical protein WR25_03553 [Diploscapter pachys]
MLDDIQLDSLERVAIEYGTLTELSGPVQHNQLDSNAEFVIDQNGLHLLCDGSDKLRIQFFLQRICPIGSKYNVNRHVSVIQFVVCTNEVFVLDASGLVYAFDREEAQKAEKKEDGTIRVKAKLLNLPKRCIKLVAGKRHCLALVEKHSSDCDEEVFNEDENLCYCNKCAEERDFRLSRFMLKDELDSVREDSKERSTSTAETRPSRLEKRETYTSPTTCRFFSLKRHEQILKANTGHEDIVEDRIDESGMEDEPGEMTRELWSFGKNQSGQLGHGDTVDRFEPKQITFFQDHFIIDIVCGDEYSAALSSVGEGQIPLRLDSGSDYLILCRIDRTCVASRVALLFDLFKHVKLLRDLSLFYRSLLDNLNNDIPKQKLLEELHRSAWNCFHVFSLLSAFFNASVNSELLPGSTSIVKFLSSNDCVKSAIRMIRAYCNVEAFGCLDENQLSGSELQVVDRLATRCSVEATSVASKLNAIKNAVLLWLDTMVGLAQHSAIVTRILRL